MISIRDIRKSFGPILALDGVSFELSAGETFGLLGPNGAGKSTAINIICGLLRPDSGTATIDGEDPHDPRVRQRLGVVPQVLAIYDELTAEENLRFAGRMFGFGGSRLRQRTAECLELVGLQDRARSRVSTFSGGMKRRLNLACSLIHHPPVLLLDEPTVGVDPQSRNLLFNTFQELGRNGTTILYTTHYMEEAARLCDRVAILDHGHILALDTVAGLIAGHAGTAKVEIELAALPGASVKLPGSLEGNTLLIESADPATALARFAGLHIPFTRVQVHQPTLEDVFLNLTGRSLRDE